MENQNSSTLCFFQIKYDQIQHVPEQPLTHHKMAFSDIKWALSLGFLYNDIKYKYLVDLNVERRHKL